MQLTVEIDSDREIIAINGIRYSYALFGDLGFAPIGRVLRIVSRGDGVVTMQTIEEEKSPA